MSNTEPFTQKTCYQISMNPYFGGGEVYTRFLVLAFSQIGWRSVLFVHKKARYWQQLQRLQMPNCELLAIEDLSEIESHLPGPGQKIISHGAIDTRIRNQLAQHHRLFAMVHMPLYDFAPDSYAGYEKIFAVSAYVAASLKDAHVDNAWPEPLYAVADIQAYPPEKALQPFQKNSPYDWDKRKGRDLLCFYIEPWIRPLLPRPYYQRRSPITLAIVSRLTPIKQFPLLFSWLAPVLAEFPHISLDIFGAGGYASVRDLRKALRPARAQVRFWGFQPDVALIYSHVDFVLSGLPEQEALGLNLLEAQYCNTPVLAVNAPPFTETVVHGKTGYLYTDPRKDQGQDFRRLLQQLQDRTSWPQPYSAPEHLERFSFSTFCRRLQTTIHQLHWDQLHGG